MLYEIKINFYFLKYSIKIYAEPTLKNITRWIKKRAKLKGYKNPKVYIYDNATATDKEDISWLCWAIYVEETK